MKNNKLTEWNPAKMAEPTDFMTYEEFVEKLKQDLDITDKNWWVYDFQTPHNESEYQNELKLLQKIMHK